MNLSSNPSNQSFPTVTKPSSRLQIPQSARESLMSMMREIMEKTQLGSQQLHFIPEESIEESIVDREDIMGEFMQKSQPSNANPSLFNQPLTSPPLLSQQFSKLYQITQRCANYYTTFYHEKQSQLQIIEKTFIDLNSNLNTAFQQIIGELVRKQMELKQFLLKKYQEIVMFRNQQDWRLKQVLGQIANHGCAPISQDLSLQLHNYASTLDQFYTLMQDIEKSNFKQMVQDSVNFINNLVAQQIRVALYEKIPSRLTQKHIIKSSSKEFLTESRESSVQTKTDTFGILDIESFTKLFFDNEEKVDLLGGRDRKNENPSKQPDQKNKVPMTEPNGSTKMIKSVSRQCLDHFNDSKPKQNLKQISIKKETSLSPSSPHKLKSALDNCQNQSQLELIRKISYQQSNRSAKIRGYMVTFQQPKPAAIQVLCQPNQSKEQTNRRKNLSKSPSQVSKTPTRMNKSAEKKPLTASVVSVNQSNDQKMKNSSLKTSRNSTVSEFKVPTNRRQSLVSNK